MTTKTKNILIMTNNKKQWIKQNKKQNKTKNNK